MISRATIALVAMALLAACTSPAEQRQRAQTRAATQFLERQGSIGDPGRVAAADFAFARMAREQGQWAATRQYWADGAIVDAPAGFALAADVLAGLAEPETADVWEPTNVWSSCDGTLAVSLGRYRHPDGIVGDYVTVWALQSDNSYRWTYATGTPDDPQPVPEPEEELPEDAIVVPGMTSIEGRVADCDKPAGDEALLLTVSAGVVRSGSADDGSLHWQSDLLQSGQRQVHVHYFRNGAWEQVVDLTIPASE